MSKERRVDPQVTDIADLEWVRPSGSYSATS